MRSAVAFFVVLCLAAPVVGGDLITVELEKKETTVDVKVGGEPFARYNFDKQLPKPFLHPVRTRFGKQFITRPLENPEDHPHHKGVWLAIDEVNDVKFWAEKGKIENASIELPVPTGIPATIRAVNHWLGTDGKPLLIEKTDIGFWPNGLIVYDILFEAGAADVSFGDTKEGLFGIRLANPLREKVGGNVINADGKRTTKECWGQESKWVDYWGQLNDEICGVALFDHPKNFRKSRYHVRDYGLFTISPFGQSAYTGGMLPADPYKLAIGQTLRLRYGLFVHHGDTQAGGVAEAYELFLNATDK